MPLPTYRKNQSTLLWIVGAVVVLLLLCCGIGAVGALLYAVQSNQVAESAVSPSSSQPPTATPMTAAPTPSDIYVTFTQRQWKLLAERPNDYIGRTFVVYGQVTQFDDATGEDTFAARVGPRRTTDEGGYDTTMLLDGDPKLLRSLAEGEEFQAEVMLLGTYLYSPPTGGPLRNVPWLVVRSLQEL
ncbi:MULTISPECIES: hypothetical protein [unclassified Micromonospora]|uniref:hypothetical protein n=1 Tax=unclassified Micromonospora TaxID=2617518 RepID=UPI0015901C04|nr:hypothetical protein [Verrucosispora sp. NA02020]QKW15193.1 hypothetical protein HUT12_22145 [Verrucosispora sp. NA02020]